MNAYVHKRSDCRLCRSRNVVRSVPLAQVPIVSPNVGSDAGEDGAALTRVVAPLDNYLCADCGLNQLVYVVDPALIYRSYLYRTSVSLGLPEHFRRLAEAVIGRLALQPGALVCEFGSNDGTLLNHFKGEGFLVQGVDPARGIAAEATARGVPTLPEFFDVALAQRIREERGPAKVVIANNAMANIDDLDEIFSGVATLIDDDGAFVFETQYALDVFDKTLLDVIYHEHISLFSVQPVSRACGRFGLEVFDAERIPTKGGSIRFWLQRQGGPRPVAARVGELIALEQESGLYDLAHHQRFAERVSGISHALQSEIDAVRAAGGVVGAYGTSVGCAALIHQFELEQRLDVLFDDTPFKTRLDGPGYSLPVMTADGVYEKRPSLIVILAWRYADQIVAKHQRYLDEGGRFLVPLPDLSERRAG
ncbi:class I SAM-dependent methyltransferase [Mangrovibrevibacter kandeliae]|uniref:class I SAM-dependent methyltransferase n=1 Tax=Mangrovibrevibacter kandeliae TaxID=2968473 RepID=UPI002118B91D|nr:class I SAM-dependent methyltransferase [Aurantimonas sp. CSK15Z-1]MCQ8782833.1 class I SAM-dependent methyltransferase [Aurantimonas sp. CSK15Z-1]